MAVPRIPGYEIIEQLPLGGMSIVYKARQISLNRVVALKTLPSELIRDDTDIEQFLLEARLTAGLNHPNIVQIYEFGKSEDGVYYFAMKYVTGYTIESWIRRKGRISETDTLLVAQAVAGALDYAWRTAGIIHCDVKPDNLIVDGDGTIKLADLGVAQSIGRTMIHQENDETIVAGTPEYMAPEQVRGDGQMDCRVDIYALGATMYHCLTGKKPFEGLSSNEIMICQEDGFIPDPLDICPYLSFYVSSLVESFMAKNRDFRHASWADVREDIQRVLDGRYPARLLPENGLSTVNRSDQRALVVERIRQDRPAVIEASPAMPEEIDLFRKDDRCDIHPAGMSDRAGAEKKRISYGVAGLAVFLVVAGVFHRFQNTEVAPDDIPQVVYHFSDKTNELRHADAVQTSKSVAEEPPENPEPTAVMAMSDDQEVVERHAVDIEMKSVTDQAGLLADHLINTAAESILADEIVSAETLVQNAMNTNDFGDLQSGIKGKADITSLSVSDEVKPAPETQVLNELIIRNPGLTPECISVDILFGKIVRLEIVSLYICDIGPVGMLEALQSFVCMAFDPAHGKDRADSAPLNDLAPLRGLRLRELTLSGTCVHDLSPLEGMPLEMLDISNTNVRNLAPLKNLPIKSLKITHTPVRNITPIQNLPIERIWLDFSPSEHPRETDGKFRDVLRKMLRLKFINGRQARRSTNADIGHW